MFVVSGTEEEAMRTFIMSYSHTRPGMFGFGRAFLEVNAPVTQEWIEEWEHSQSAIMSAQVCVLSITELPNGKA